MRAAEEAAFASGVQVEALMNKAGAGIAQAVTKFFQKPGRCIVFAGKGHNAGDALLAAQCLERRGWKIEVRPAFKEADCSDLMRKKLADLCRRPPEILGGALNYGGRMEGLLLDEWRKPETKPKEIIASPTVRRRFLARRKYNSYKNQFGRIGVVAGSKGFVGAALMTSQGALRAGAGLVEVFVPEEIYEIVAAAAPMEAMVKPVQSYRDLLKQRADVWAVGPGLGKSRAAELLDLIEKAKQPVVIDADGLNILSEKTSVLRRCKGERLLTPHPGEMKRLFPDHKEPRAATAKKFCNRFAVTLLLKGSRTIVAERDRPLSYNTTGNPGMATGGMGDVLTGVCAGLVGQGLSLYNAARVGAWLCGRAAEIAIFNNGQSEQSLLAQDVLDHLGDAFDEL